MGPEQLAAYRAELAQFVRDNEETIRREQEKRREKVFILFKRPWQENKPFYNNKIHYCWLLLDSMHRGLYRVNTKFQYDLT